MSTSPFNADQWEQAVEAFLAGECDAAVLQALLEEVDDQEATREIRDALDFDGLGDDLAIESHSEARQRLRDAIEQADVTAEIPVPRLSLAGRDIDEDQTDLFDQPPSSEATGDDELERLDSALCLRFSEFQTPTGAAERLLTRLSAVEMGFSLDDDAPASLPFPSAQDLDQPMLKAAEQDEDDDSDA